MTTTIQDYKQLDDLADDLQRDDETLVQSLQDSAPATDEKSEDAEPANAGEAMITAELLLHPFNTAAQAIWLCEKLKKDLKAEVLYLTGTPEGTVIKVTIRTPVALVDFLAGMSEVAEAWEEAAPQARNRMGLLELTTSLPANHSREEDRIVCVALKPL